MESYSVARRIASTNNELHILNASQELFANGVANLLGSVSSAYPVSGSFSRSSLNQGMCCLVLCFVCLMCLCMSFFGRCAMLCGVLTSVVRVLLVCVCGYMCVLVNIWVCWSIHVHTRVVHYHPLPLSLIHLIFSYSVRCEDSIVQAGYPHGGVGGTQHSH